MAASEGGGKGKRRLMPAIDNVVWARAPGSMQLRSERGRKSLTWRSEREKMGRGRSDKWVTKRQQRGTRGWIESTKKTVGQTEGGEAGIEWHELIAVERLKLTIPLRRLVHPRACPSTRINCWLTSDPAKWKYSALPSGHRLPSSSATLIGVLTSLFLRE